MALVAWLSLRASMSDRLMFTQNACAARIFGGHNENDVSEVKVTSAWPEKKCYISRNGLVADATKSCKTRLEENAQTKSIKYEKSWLEICHFTEWWYRLTYNLNRAKGNILSYRRLPPDVKWSMRNRNNWCTRNNADGRWAIHFHSRGECSIKIALCDDAGETEWNLIKPSLLNKSPLRRSNRPIMRFDGMTGQMKQNIG